MKAFNPYLNFAGQTEQAFAFYRSVFGGEYAAFIRFGESPMGARVPAADRDKLMHVSLPLPGGQVLMGSDACESMGQTVRPGNNHWISITTDSEAETSELFAALSAGGTAQMRPEKMFWGSFFAMCTDRFGTQWMLNYAYPKA
jgi:PhnB protein